MYRFTPKDGAPDAQASCEGDYLVDKSRGNINDKPVFVNEESSLFLAAQPSSGWCITDLIYFDQIQQDQGTFGGYCFGGGTTPTNDAWELYEVVELIVYQFSLKSGESDYGDCEGYYVEDETRGFINDHPVFSLDSSERLLIAEPEDGWAITSFENFPEIQANPSAFFGGFHSCEGDKPENGNWDLYTVTKYDCEYEIDSTFYDESSWEKIENTDVTYGAAENSGVVRTDEDFAEIRRRCVELDCGGFSWRKPHYNQFGEEDEPPVCFFYRKTQDDLRENMESSDAYDFYLAPSQFAPDCSFKPYRDSAASCHCQWEVSAPVHSFACQVMVPEATLFTYYCVAGFHCGYSGIQQHDANMQQMLFSVWNDTTASEKVTNSYVCPGFEAKPFDGEGMGMQVFGVSGESAGSSSTPVASWTPGQEYTVVVKAFPYESGTELVCYIHKPLIGWIEIGRDLRPESSEENRGKLSGLYSFIEDFTGNSLRRSVRASAWVQDEPDSPWRPIVSITGSTTVEADVPNKSVRLVAEEDYEVVELITGGEALEDFSLYSGELNAKPVPSILNELPERKI